MSEVYIYLIRFGGQPHALLLSSLYSSVLPTANSPFPATRHSSHPPPHLPPHPHRHTSGFRNGKGQALLQPVKNAHTHHTTHTHSTRALLPLRFKYRRISYSSLVARLRRSIYCKAEARTQTLYANTSKHLATLVSSLVEAFLSTAL